MDEFRDFVAGARTCTDSHGLAPTSSVTVRDCPWQSVVVANCTLSLLNLATNLLSRQLDRLAADFEKEGGFTERLYRVRRSAREAPE